MSTKLILPVGKGDHIRGNRQASITLVEYGDYECPYCGQAHAITALLQAELGDQLCFVFRNFPLTQIHPHAQDAALAAEAAALQGKFWEMHDLLFENQDKLENAYLVGFARILRLNIDQFLEDMESPEVAQRVREDFMSGIRSGVNGTPTFFINGWRHEGSFDYSSLLTAIENAARMSRV